MKWIPLRPKQPEKMVARSSQRKNLRPLLAKTRFFRLFGYITICLFLSSCASSGYSRSYIISEEEAVKEQTDPVR